MANTIVWTDVMSKAVRLDLILQYVFLQSMNAMIELLAFIKIGFVTAQKIVQMDLMKRQLTVPMLLAGRISSNAMTGLVFLELYCVTDILIVQMAAMNMSAAHLHQFVILQPISHADLEDLAYHYHVFAMANQIAQPGRMNLVENVE